MHAGRSNHFHHTRAQALAAHFHQTKARDSAHLDPCPIGFQTIFHPLFNGIVVAAIFHVDEVDDNQTSQVAQTQLAGHFIRGLEVGFQRCLFD